jgi:hypothetical protein
MKKNGNTIVATLNFLDNSSSCQTTSVAGIAIRFSEKDIENMQHCVQSLMKLGEETKSLSFAPEFMLTSLTLGIDADKVVFLDDDTLAFCGSVTTHDYKFLAELRAKKCRLDMGKDPEVRMLVFGDGDIHIQIHCYDGGEVYETSEPISFPKYAEGNASRGTKGYAGD